MLKSKIKKIYILILVTMVILLTSCQANYSLEYKDGKFYEDIKLVSEKEDVLGSYSLKEVQEELGSKYDTTYLVKDNKEYLEVKRTYNKDEIKKSYVVENCLDDNSFKIDNKTYHLNIMDRNNIKCKYLTDVKFKFKSDTGVLRSNAKLKDRNNNTYTWDKLDDGIELSFMKDKNKVKKVNIYNIIMFSIFIIISIYIIYLVRKKNEKA